MIWKAIGKSATGTSHIAADKGCDDSICYKIITDNYNNEVLICCASDGAGSAKYSDWASTYTTITFIERLTENINQGFIITEAIIYSIAEEIYEGIRNEADSKQELINEFSCTLLGCCITDNRSAFFQIGDGAVVRNDGLDFFTAVWWPQNGEYLNTTSFLIDDPTFKDLRVTIIYERVDEVAIFTDGLQMLALNMEGGVVHQPFFADLFRVVRIAQNEDEVAILQVKLEEFINSTQVNNRTDDDKTLFLASRLNE